MTNTRSILTALLALLSGGCVMNIAGRAEISGLQVSPNRRFLVRSDGSPFFWLGDTGWGLLNKVNLEQAGFYLRDRKDRQFNVIQVFLTATKWMPANVAGEAPFLDDDPTRLNPKFFDHVDKVLGLAEDLGLYICLGVGEVVRPDSKWRVTVPEKAYTCGWVVGHRLRHRHNLIWNVGHDWHAVLKDVDDRPLIRAMAEGVADGVNGAPAFDGKADYSTTLMTYHASMVSSAWFQEDAWLDFNMVQTGENPRSTVRALKKDYSLQPTKPTLLAEGGYENSNHENRPPWATPHFARFQAYVSVFAGGFGHTYGASGLWQFSKGGPGYQPWQTALNFEGGAQMRHLRKLIESRPMLTRIPDSSLIVSITDLNSPYQPQPTRAADGSHAFVYLPLGEPVTVALNKLSGNTVRASWFNPRDGTEVLVGEFPSTGARNFAPPSSGSEDDWVLVLEDATRPAPIRRGQE